MTEDFEPWYLRRHPLVIGTLVAMCGDADAAADATDEAFSRALGHWGRVSQMASPDAWVTTVAVNELKRRLRRRSTEARLLRRRQGRPSESAPDANPEVWAAVRELPERQRLAVVLRYVGDFDEAHVAEVMGVARGTVAATLHAARARLAEVLDPEGLEAPHG